MSKKPIVEVDEDMLRDAMLEVPAMRNRQSAGTTVLQSEALKEEPPLAQTETAKRGPYRKRQKEDGQPYSDRFLVNDGVRSRVSTYVNRETHEKIKRFLSNAAPDISVVSYINNILIHHLDQYEDEIAQLYRSGIDKPF